MSDTRILSQIEALESESIHIIREVVAEMERPVLMFSGGKDSLVMLHLAVKAFAPARVPFPVLHVDTGLNFAEVLACRDRWVDRLGLNLIIASVPDAIKRGLVREEPNGSRNRIQTPVLLEALEEGGFDAAFGGGRRDEEKARAKERVFSFRDDFGQWGRRTSDRKSGICTTAECIRASRSGCSRCRTGPNWISGATWLRRRSISQSCMSPATAKSSNGTACCTR